MTNSDYNSVTYETSFILEQTPETMKVLEQARSDPRKVKELFKLDVDIEVKVEEVDKIMTESEKTLHRLENELDRLNINSSTRQ